MKDVFKACLLLLLVLLIALPLMVQAESVPQPRVWEQEYPFSSPVSLDNVTIIYNQQKIANIAPIVDSAQTAYASIERYFGDYMAASTIENGFTPDSRIFRATIEVTADNNEFRLLSGVGSIPDEVSALSWNEGINGLVVIKSPDMLPDFQQVLTYQLARVAERTMMTKYRSMPEWYLDGTAMYVAGNVTDAQRNIATMSVARGSWMSVRELDDAYKNMTFYNQNEPYYYNARAHAAVLASYIAQTYGNSNLIGILRDYSVHGNLTEAFINRTLGHDPESINSNLKDMLAGSPGIVGGPEENALVDGFLKYADGKPANTFTISFSPPDRPSSLTNVTTGQAGSYNVSLTPGTYKITVLGQALSGEGTITLKAGEILHQNLSLTVKAPANLTPLPEMPSDDLVLPGLIVAVNLVALVALLIVLRRNWH
ncbi:MAG: hypothetical protein A4E28_01552 [Methanocella sp. PtaU1.Bin125]|nr:MAG: hypothetical protein A4E28_01552 [Methanocella sp. PtaU1.Bin125]